MQPCGTIYCSLIALHISSDIIVHHQELLNCIFIASGDTYVRHCLPVSWENQNCTYVSPEAVKISSEAPDNER